MGAGADGDGAGGTGGAGLSDRGCGGANGGGAASRGGGGGTDVGFGGGGGFSPGVKFEVSGDSVGFFRAEMGSVASAAFAAAILINAWYASFTAWTMRAASSVAAGSPAGVTRSGCHRSSSRR